MKTLLTLLAISFALLGNAQTGLGLYNNLPATLSCAGTCDGLVSKITNSSSGTLSWTPPVNTTNGLASYVSPTSTNIVVVIVLRKRDQFAWCGTNSVSFPSSTNEQYQVKLGFKGSPVPPHLAPTTVNLTWQ